jgi:hypothetical protein
MGLRSRMAMSAASITACAARRPDGETIQANDIPRVQCRTASQWVDLLPSAVQKVKMSNRYSFFSEVQHVKRV